MCARWRGVAGRGPGDQAGSTLVLALLVMTFLFVLGASFLTSLTRDHRFGAYQHRSEQAWLLALAGLEFMKARPPGQALAPGETLRVSLPPGQADQFFEVSLEADGTVISRGTVRGSSGLVGGGGSPGAERWVVAPGGAWEEAHEGGL